MTDVAIADIRIEGRHRKRMGDLEGLARNIEELGLLHPVVVTPDNRLIAGERRVKAAKLLGWQRIPVTIIDIPELIRGELAENTIREDLAPSDAVDIGADIEALEIAAAKERQGTRTDLQPCEKFTQSSGKSMDKVAAAVGMSRPTYEKASEIVEAARAEPEKYGAIAEKMDETGKVDGAYKALKAAQRTEQREALAASARAIAPNDRWHVEIGDVRSYATSQRFDFIITDPPYPRQYLELYGVLAKRAREWLEPGGLLLAMCGQSYLDKIMGLLSKHLAYYWTGAYLTPGQPTPLRERQVNTSWKPILVYGLRRAKYKGKIFSDVWTSDGKDKTHHKWGQSESGMLAMIRQVCLPGQSIFDPFCGAGTTGVAALKHGCLFAGIDIDADSLDIARARLAEVAP